MDKFEKKLNDKILSQFIAAKEWGDLLSILKGLITYIKKQIEKKEINLSLLIDKVTISKRLAQCLNPQLPAGVHETALEIYEIILKDILIKNNNCLGESLGYYASGLFPFFQNASINNKKLYIDKIIKGIFCKLEHEELELCITGLLVSILPGLDDQNEDINKALKDVFNTFRNIISNRIFFGVLWSIILRNPILRPSGMKYICEIIPNFQNYIKLNKDEKYKIANDYFPMLNTMILNALCSVIEDEDVITIRLGMDFLISRFPLNEENTLLDDDEKTNLLISVLKLYIKNEYSTTRRLSNWLLGGMIPDEIDIKSDQIKYVLKLLINALKGIFDIKKEDISFIQLKNNIKIIEQLISQQIQLSDDIIENISFNIISSVVNYWRRELNEKEDIKDNEIITKVGNFFNKDKSFIQWLWISLAKNLQEFNFEEDQDIINTLNKLILPLKFVLLYVDIKTIDLRLRYYFPIISNLLSIISKLVINDRESLKQTRQIIFISLVFLRKLQTKIKDEKINITKTLNIEEDKISLINNFLIPKDVSFESINKNEKISILTSLTESIIIYQNFYISMLNILIDFQINDQITRNEMRMFKQSTELLIRLQEYANQDKIPDWIFKIESFIFKGKILLSLESSNYILDIIMQNFEDNCNIYRKIQNNLTKDDIKDNIINEESLKKLMSVGQVKKNFLELLLSKLWLMLKDQTYQRKIIDLLIKIFQIDKDIFINMIISTFSFKEYQMDVEAINNFAQFWKLSNEYYEDLIIFKKGECILETLNYLDHENPLLRHLSKSWLNQTIKQFYKVVDPILSILLDINIIFEEKNKKLIFTKEYNTKNIIGAFRYMKNLILNVSGVNYFINNYPNASILSIDALKNTIDLKKDNYLYLLIKISLRFIKGKYYDENNKIFQRDNYSVNATACEFLEFLLSYIGDKNQLLQIAIFIIESVVELLDEAIEIKDEVMQIQLLNLLKQLLFNTQSEHNKHKEEITSLIMKSTLIDCLIKGIRIEYFFVRRNYIEFLEGILPILSNLFYKTNCTQLINYAMSFISTFSQFLIERVYYTKRVKKDTNKFSHFNESNKNFIFKNYLDEYQEYKRYDENDIMLILKGLKILLSYFIHIKYEFIKKKETFDKTFWIKYVDEFINQTKGNTTTFGELFTKLFSNDELDDEKDDLENKNNIPNIIYLKQLNNLLVSFLICWNGNSESYMNYDYCLNNNGILAFKIDDEYNIKGNNELNNNENLENESKEQIRNILIDLTFNLFIKNPIDFMNNYINIWCESPVEQSNLDFNKIKDNKNDLDNFYKASKDKQFKLSMIELLISLSIPLPLILYSIQRVINFHYQINKNSYVKGKNKMLKTSYTESIYESKILHFLYSYLIYFSKEKIDKKDLCEYWKRYINIFNIIIENTKCSYTYCWIYELLNLLLEKFSIMNIINENSIRKDIGNIFTIITKKISDISFYCKFDSEYQNDEYLVLPILPTVYTEIAQIQFPEENLYKKLNINIHQQKKKFESTLNSTIVIKKNNNIKKPNSKEPFIFNDIFKNEPHINDKSFMIEFYKFLFKVFLISSEYEEVNRRLIQVPESLQKLYRQLSYITLYNLFLTNCTRIFIDNENKIKYFLTDIIQNIIKLMQKSKFSNELFQEISTKFLSDLMDATHFAFLVGKQMIMDYFLGNSFFDTTQVNLREWKKILSIYTRYNSEMITELLKQMESFLIFKKDTSFKIRNLRRISFVIYSCEKDRFSSKLNIIKDKVKEYITSYSDNGELEGEIFLMIRILFLRFSHDNIMEMIKSFWPIIFGELDLNIKEKKKLQKNESIILLTESFKFIELLSLANIEEFSLYQWIFIIDTFDMNRLNTSDPDSLLSSLLNQEKKIFHPIAMNVSKNWNNDYNNLIGNLKAKSELVILPEKKTHEELVNKVKEFFYSIGDMNNYRVQVNYEQIEEVIEKDFLNNGK